MAGRAGATENLEYVFCHRKTSPGGGLAHGFRGRRGAIDSALKRGGLEMFLDTALRRRDCYEPAQALTLRSNRLRFSRAFCRPTGSSPSTRNEVQPWT